MRVQNASECLTYGRTYQLMALGFLSVHMLPLRLSSCMSAKCRCNTPTARSAPFDSMFMPIASPVVATKRTYRLRDACTTCSRWRRANLENNNDSNELALTEQPVIYVYTYKYMTC